MPLLLEIRVIQTLYCGLKPSGFTAGSRSLVFPENGAGNEIRTRDPDLGKVVLYQLSYSRTISLPFRPLQNRAVVLF